MESIITGQHFIIRSKNAGVAAGDVDPVIVLQFAGAAGSPGLVNGYSLNVFVGQANYDDFTDPINVLQPA